MRESTTRGAAIDLSEFERRLRGGEPAPEKAAPDPLTELARLMQGEDASRAADRVRRMLAPDAVAAQQGRAPGAPEPAAPKHYQDHGSPLRGSLPPEPPPADQFYPDAHHYQQQAHYPEGHYGDDRGHGDGAYEAERYRSQLHSPQDQHGGGAHQAVAGHEWQDDSPAYLDYGPQADDGPFGAEPPAAEPAGWRRYFKPWHAVAAIAVIAAVSIGWGFAHRSGSGGSREIALINAPAGPAKVQPPAEANEGALGQGATVLDRTESAPVKRVVSSEEQAIDPKVAPKAVKLGDGPVDAPHDPAAPTLPEPKKVRTVSVRPDGTVIENDSLPPAVAKVAEQPSPETGAALDAAKRGVTPKSPAKPATTATAQKPKPKVAAAPKEATEEPAGGEAGTPAPAASGGGFAVQFGAAGTEGEARALISKIVGQYGSALGGHKPTFKIAKVNDKTVYRVRVGGFSKEGAVGVCEKVKASGGSCFIAAN